MRTHLIASLLLAVPAAASTQAQRVVTAEDYARAEQFLGSNTFSLVSGIPDRPTWLPDGRAWYRVSTAEGSEFVMVDPARGSREPAFDHARLAAALGAAMDREVEPAQLPFRSFELSADGHTLTFTVGGSPFGRRMGGSGGGQEWACDLEAYTCAQVAQAEDERREDPPPNSVVSPDGSRAAFIREYNLWMRDLSTGDETQLTSDGIEDFGYATNNAGWVKSDRPVLTWSPDSRKIATFQHDGRGV
ncbi:MAG: DPP IV N-terminal domain-containing protein, partial [Gemmatimonadales bacterium]